MTLRTYFLLAALSLGIATIVKALQVALTPEAWAVLRNSAERLMASSGFGFLVALTGIVFCLSLCAAAWERAERRYEREERRLAVAVWSRRGGSVTMGDTSSLADDSPSALPETWRAPCGEVVEFPTNNDSRGGAA